MPIRDRPARLVQGEHDEVHDARSPEGGWDADGLGQAVEADGVVVFEVLAGVEDVEAASP